MSEIDKYRGRKPAWCPGCGNFGIRGAFMRALSESRIEPHEVIAVSGIGQSGKLPHYVKCNTFNGLHGRTLPVATGIRLANHKILTVAFAGDGDCYGEGGNHLIHAIRRNINVKLFVHDNQVYGLTKGQASPTSMVGMTTRTQPFGSLSEQFNPISMAIALNCSFIARAYVGEQDQLVRIMKAAFNHDGFCLVDILQPCVTFNRINTFKWYGERVYDTGEGHDPANRTAALQLAMESDDRIPTGVIYRNERRTYESMVPALEEGTLVNGGGLKKEVDSMLEELF